MLWRGPEQLGLVLPALRESTAWVALTPPQRAAYQRANGERSPLAQATKREKACAYALGRSAKAEAAAASSRVSRSLGKAVVFAENLHHLTVTEPLLDAVGIGWFRIDGSCSRKQRAAALKAFRTQPGVRVLLGTKVLERGLDGLQHCPVLTSLGPSSTLPARLSASDGCAGPAHRTRPLSTSQSSRIRTTSEPSSRPCAVASSRQPRSSMD